MCGPSDRCEVHSCVSAAVGAAASRTKAQPLEGRHMRFELDDRDYVVYAERGPFVYSSNVCSMRRCGSQGLC